MGIEKQIIIPPQTGGAPIFIEDIAQLQSNANELVLPLLKHNAEQNGFRFSYSNGPGAPIIRDTKAGAFITPPIYSNVVDDGSNFVTCDVAPFSVLLGDKVCFYPGGSIQVRSFTAVYPSYIAVTPGVELKEARIFRNGETKDVVVTNEVVLTEVPTGQFGGAVPTSIKNQYAVALDPRFNHENGFSISNKLYWQKHPNFQWDTAGLISSINNANSAIQSSDLLDTIGNWLNILVEANSDVTASNVLARVDGLKSSRLAGKFTIQNIANSSPIKLGTIPFQPQFTQYFSNNNFSEFEIRTDKTIWVTFTGSAPSTAIVYLDGITIPTLF